MLDARAEDVADEPLRADRGLLRRPQDTRDEQDPVANDYQPLKPDRLYLTPTNWRERARTPARSRGCTPFEAAPDALDVIDCGGRVGRDFAPERQNENVNVFEAAVAHVRALREARQDASSSPAGSDGSRERLSHVLAEHGLKSLELVSSYAQAQDGARRRAAAGRGRAGARLRVRRSRRHRRAGHSRRPAGAAGQAQAPRRERARRGLGADAPAISSSTSTTASAASSA